MAQLRFKQLLQTERGFILWGVIVGFLVELVFIAIGWCEFTTKEVLISTGSNIFVAALAFAVKQASAPSPKWPKKQITRR
jgi:hypothetical protein